MRLLTSNLKRAVEPPKMEEAKCNQRRMDNPEETKPPRYRYSLRLETKAAPEKHAKAKEVATNALKMRLHQWKSNVTNVSTTTNAIFGSLVSACRVIYGSH